jgi:hypothetical protein
LLHIVRGSTLGLFQEKGLSTRSFFSWSASLLRSTRQLFALWLV